jgi:hypothetical protein
MVALYHGKEKVQYLFLFVRHYIGIFETMPLVIIEFF